VFLPLWLQNPMPFETVRVPGKGDSDFYSVRNINGRYTTATYLAQSVPACIPRSLVSVALDYRDIQRQTGRSDNLHTSRRERERGRETSVRETHSSRVRGDSSQGASDSIGASGARIAPLVHFVVLVVIVIVVVCIFAATIAIEARKGSGSKP